MPPYAQLLVIVAAMVAFWAIVMRPARTQQRRVQQLQDTLEVGEDVVLSAGIFGTVRALTEGKAEIEIAPGTVITVARQVVVRRVDELERAETGTTDEATGSDIPDHPDEPGQTQAQD